MNSESLIDNIFTNFNPSISKSALVYHDISDHYPIILQVLKPNTKNKMKNKSHTNIRRFFPQEAIDRFKNYLLSINWEFTNNSDRSISDVNIIYNEFLDVFCNGFNTCFPLKSTSVNYRRTPRKEWMTYGLAK